jgi:hypothetical protein
MRTQGHPKAILASALEYLESKMLPLQLMQKQMRYLLTDTVLGFESDTGENKKGHHEYTTKYPTLSTNDLQDTASFAKNQYMLKRAQNGEE